MASERLRTAVVVAGVAVLALAATHTINLWLLDGDMRWLEAGSGGSIFELMATATLGLCAAAAALLAFRRPDRRIILVALAGGLTIIFLLDALAGADNVGALGNAAVAVILAAVFVLLWRHARELGAGGSLVRAGLLLLALSVAIRGADPIISALEWEHGDLGYEAKVVAKHGAELAGWILVGFGLIPAALSRRSQVQNRRAAAGVAGTG